MDFVTFADPVTIAVLAGAVKPVVVTLAAAASSSEAVGKAADFGVNLAATWADRILCRGLRGFKEHLSTETPQLNHDLQRAARGACLEATRELIVQAQGRASVARQADAKASLNLALERAKEELKRNTTSIPTVVVKDVDRFLIDEENAPEKVRQFQERLEATLREDLNRWSPGSADLEPVTALLRDGWEIESGIHRDWQGVAAIYFMDAIKSNARISAIFQSQMLAKMANGEPALKSIRTFEGFSAQFDEVVTRLGRIEDKLDRTPGLVVDELERRKLLREAGRLVRLDEALPDFTERPDAFGWLDGRFAAGRRLLLIHGEPGSGKSSVGNEYGWKRQGDYEALVFQVCSERSLDEVGVDLARRVGLEVRDRPPDEQLQAAKDWLRGRKSLLILDDVWDDAMRKLDPGEPVRVVVTSRKPWTFQLPQKDTLALGGFKPGETEEYLNQNLEGWLDRNGEALREFAGHVEHLPYAVAVAASLLRKSQEPEKQAIATLRVEVLADGGLDLPKLLKKAVEGQKKKAQRLLKAMAVCAPEGVWLRFAFEVAGLDAVIDKGQVEALVGASLLRRVDREAQTFSIHRTLHVLLGADPEAEKLKQRHVNALSGKYERWEGHPEEWSDCSRLMEEVMPALERLAGREAWDAQDDLAYRAHCHAHRTGALASAMQIVEKVGVSARGRGSRQAEQAWLGNQALILTDWGRLDEAWALNEREERICVDLHDRAGLSACYSNQALILKSWGRLDEARALLKQQEEICRDLGDRAGLSTCYGNQAGILKDWGRLDEAMALHRQEEEICKKLRDRAGLSRCYGNQAGILRAQGDLEKAMALLKKQEGICEELGDRAGLAFCYTNQGAVLEDLGDLAGARAKYETALELFTDIGMPREEEVVRGNLDLLRESGGTEV